MKNNKGITLIALVITIIVLIILAGVAINLTLGENGIFTRAETAKLKYEIGKAEEELDIKIAELQVEKQGSATLQDVVDMLKAEEDMDYIVSLKEIASITGVETIGDANEIYVVYKIYQFRVDNQLQTEFISIVENYTADVQISSRLKSYNGKNEDEKYTATMEIKVESQGQVESIEIATLDGTVTEVPTSLPYTKEIQVEIGQKYIVKVTTPDGKYKRYLIEEKAEETIKTAQELATFRDKVNSGLTYEGKTVKLANDIDLSRVCYKVDGTTTNDVSWEPIGTTTNSFKGTFDGDYKEIQKLYINTVSDYQGLFGYTTNATITSVIIGQGSNIQGKSNVGAIVGYIENTTVQNCGNNSVVKAQEGIVGGNIGSSNNSTITGCYNKGSISSSVSAVGGIVGYNNATSNHTVSYCYNTGAITGSNSCAGIIGYCDNYIIINNCYNKGAITTDGTSNFDTGGIVGRLLAYGQVNYCFNKGLINTNMKCAAGGIIGENESWNGSTRTSESASNVNYCYNSGNISSQTTIWLGGICGGNASYCGINNCYILETAEIKNNNETASGDIGKSNNYVGKIIGKNDSSNVNNNGVLDGDSMPTPYYVVNSLSDEESQYWSNVNKNDPTLKWES